MSILMRILDQVQRTDIKVFKKYMLILLGIVTAIFSFITWRYYTGIAFYKKKISLLNDMREEVRAIRQNMVQVQTQRSRVYEMLQEEVDFKIAGYFNDLLVKLNLFDNKKTEETSQIDREDSYRESELVASLTNMNMKQLTELLYELEQKKRIYIKKLDIEKSKKGKNQLDVTLIIATLLHKEVE
ncbi:MAG TPA: hypothetical protein VL201_01975 [Patescibacteria group bacterium]|jgi:hypothetical protein|nr:hypothetical protein [Patescibacteria group bacterium]